MHLTRRDLVLGAGALLLLAVAIVRAAVPDRSRMRPVSIEGISFSSVKIGPHSTDVSERVWEPPTDVYVVGWSYSIPSNGAVMTVTAPPGDVLLFRVRGGQTEVRPEFLPGGTGYLIRKGQKIRAKLEVTTLDAAGMTHGGMAIIYFVPVEGN